MPTRSDGHSKRGFFAIGMEHTKTAANLGTLFRSADLFGAAFIFTVGRRYQRQSSDTMKTPRNMPLFHFTDLNHLYQTLPYDCQLVGIEMLPQARPIEWFVHPVRCVYLLGAEDNGLSKEAVQRSHHLIQLPGRASCNVAVAGSIVMFSRHLQWANK